MSAVANRRIDALIESLAGRGANREENLIRHAAGYCLQYFDFLAQGLRDFEPANSAFRAAYELLNEVRRSLGPGTHTFTPEQHQLYELSNATMRLVQYRIETFYLFAKILLDRIADMVLIAYGVPRPEFGSSHARLLTRLEAGWARRWARADELRTQARALKSTVTDFRTEVFEHRAEFRRVQGISIRADRHVRISTGGMLYPEPTDKIEVVETEALPELLARLEAYIDTVAGFIEANSRDTILFGTVQPPEPGLRKED